MFKEEMNRWNIYFFLSFLTCLVVFFLYVRIKINNKKKRQQKIYCKKKDTVHIVVVATDANRTDQLLASLSTKKGFHVHVEGLGKEWTGFDFKLKHTLEVANQLEPDDVLMHLDAYDTFVLTNADEILKKFYNMDTNIVVSTETNLYPSHELDHIRPIIEDMYPTSPNRFRWINSGTYIGYAGAIRNLLYSMPPNFHCDLPNGEKINTSDDQRCFHTMFLKERNKHGIKLDYHQDIFHCMWGVDQYSLEPKRIHSETGSMPCVIHGNGQSDSFKDVVEKIKSQST